jgi:hypothetical protein
VGRTDGFEVGLVEDFDGGFEVVGLIVERADGFDDSNVELTLAVCRAVGFFVGLELS